jgi:hypothetical protein
MNNANYDLPDSIRQEYSTKSRLPKQYRPVRIMAYIIKFIAGITGTVGIGLTIYGVLLESSAFILATGSGITTIAYAFGLYVAGSILKMMADIATNVHSAAISLERIANRNKRN